MILRSGIQLWFCLLLVLLGGCQTGGDLPADSAVAKREARAAVQNWIVLLNEGHGEEFLRAALPETVLKEKDVTAADGTFQPKFLEKFYRVLPNLHYAMQEVLMVEPVVRGGNVVFELPAEMSSNELFKDRRMYLSKTGEKWHFNGPQMR